MAVTGTVQSCYVDVFERPGCGGKARRLFGPAGYERLRVEGGSIPLGSLAVGPGAWVVGYVAGAPTTHAFWILPGKMVGDLDKTDLGRRVDSLDLLSAPPEPGHRHFASYRLASIPMA